MEGDEVVVMSSFNSCTMTRLLPYRGCAFAAHDIIYSMDILFGSATLRTNL